MNKVSQKYLKVIIIRLDAFESEIVFEKNYCMDDKDEAITAMKKYESTNNICNIYEMDFKI